MKFKYLMRGIGLGVIITAVVMGAYSRSAVADARVSVLKEYGLDEDKPILPEAQTTEDIEPTSEPVIVGGEETEPAEEVGTDATQDSDQPEDITTPDIQGNAEDENEEESSTVNVVTVEPSGDAVEIEISIGDDSGTVSRKLFNAGIIENAAEYDAYLMQHGYDKKLNAGTKKINTTDGWQEIAEKITK